MEYYGTGFFGPHHHQPPRLDNSPDYLFFLSSVCFVFSGVGICYVTMEGVLPAVYRMVMVLPHQAHTIMGCVGIYLCMRPRKDFLEDSHCSSILIVGVMSAWTVVLYRLLMSCLFIVFLANKRAGYVVPSRFTSGVRPLVVTVTVMVLATCTAAIVSLFTLSPHIVSTGSLTACNEPHFKRDFLKYKHVVGWILASVVLVVAVSVVLIAIDVWHRRRRFPAVNSNRSEDDVIRRSTEFQGYDGRQGRGRVGGSEMNGRRQEGVEGEGDNRIASLRASSMQGQLSSQGARERKEGNNNSLQDESLAGDTLLVMTAADTEENQSNGSMVAVDDEPIEGNLNLKVKSNLPKHQGLDNRTKNYELEQCGDCKKDMLYPWDAAGIGSRSDVTEVEKLSAESYQNFRQDNNAATRQSSDNCVTSAGLQDKSDKVFPQRQPMSNRLRQARVYDSLKLHRSKRKSRVKSNGSITNAPALLSKFLQSYNAKRKLSMCVLRAALLPVPGPQNSAGDFPLPPSPTAATTEDDLERLPVRNKQRFSFSKVQASSVPAVHVRSARISDRQRQHLILDYVMCLTAITFALLYGALSYQLLVSRGSEATAITGFHLGLLFKLSLAKGIVDALITFVTLQMMSKEK